MSLQMVIQVVNFLAGMMTLWYLSKPEYALITVSATILGSMAMLSNAGVAIGVKSIGGPHTHDADRFAAVVATALRLRRLMAVAIFPVMGLVLAFLLHRADADLITIVAISATALGIAIFEINASLLNTALQLRNRVTATQSAELYSAILRLALVACLLLPGLLSAITATVITLFSAWMRQWLLSRTVHDDLNLKTKEIPEDRVQMTRLIRLEAPNTVFYCLQGQITIAILSWHGSVSQIADFGALGRLAIITSLLGSFFSSVLVPKFNILQSRSLLVRRYLVLLSLALGIVAAVLGFSLLFPDVLLFFLGEKYNHLHRELPLMVANFMTTFVIGITWSLNACKAWIAVIVRANIPLTLLAQVGLAMVCPLDTLAGVLWFSLLSQIPVLMLIAIDAWRGLHQTRELSLDC